MIPFIHKWGGYYDEKGEWIRTKYCFVACPPERCDCMPPTINKPVIDTCIYEQEKNDNNRSNN